MKILITGAAGYIGSILIPALLQRGHKVIAIDNFMYSQTSLLDCCNCKTLTVVRGDARDKQVIAAHLKTADTVFPLACYTGAPLCDRDPWGARTTSLDAITMLLEMRSKQQPIIYPCTNSGYGIGQEGIYCTEQTPMLPVSLYGRLKVEAEKAVLDAGNSITLRLATVFGVSPRMRLDLLVNDFVYRAVNDRFVVLFEAQAKRNYIHVRDVVKAFIHALDNFEKMEDEPYNVGLSDANISKLELCGRIQKQLPSFYFTEAAVGEDPDKRNYIVSNDKIEATGFKPEVSLDEGIAELIKGFQIIKRNQFSNI